MRNLGFPLIIVTILSLYFTYGGCSSGDNTDKVDRCENGCPGIGGEEGVGASLAGPTNLASIDQSNVRSLVGGAFVSGPISRTVADQSAAQYLQDIEADNLRTLRLPLILSDSVRFIDLSSSAYGSRLAYNGVRTAKGTEIGSCGGRLEFVLNINDAKREFSGSFAYSKFCGQGLAVSGNARVQGTYDHAGQIDTIEFIFSNLSDDRVRMQGEITVEFVDTRIVCYMDFHAEDQAAGKVCRINQYSLNIQEFSDGIEFEFYGDYHDPDYGYVEVATTENFRLYGDGKWPSSGRLLIRGKDNATAELTAMDSINCVIEADLDGDGISDFESEVLNWEGL